MSREQVQLSAEQREDILRDLWIAHDGRWFIKTASELGFEAATRLNLTVIKSFGKTEVKRLMSDIGIQAIDDIEGLESFVRLASDLYFPKEHKFRFEVLDENSLLGEVLECYAYQNVSKTGDHRDPPMRGQDQVRRLAGRPRPVRRNRNGQQHRHLQRLLQNSVQNSLVRRLAGNWPGYGLKRPAVPSIFRLGSGDFAGNPSVSQFVA